MTKVKEDGYYLKVKLTPEEVNLVPEDYKCSTSIGGFMMLGNEREILLLQEVMSVDLSKYCFDWIKVELTNG